MLKELARLVKGTVVDAQVMTPEGVIGCHLNGSVVFYPDRGEEAVVLGKISEGVQLIALSYLAAIRVPA